MSARINKRRAAAGVIMIAMLLFFTGIPGLIPGIANSTPASATECDNLTAESPAVGNDCNEDPVSPDEFQDWKDVQRFGKDNQNQWYFDCLQTRLGISRDDVRKYSELEGQGHDLRGIFISNTNPSEEAARDKLEADGVKDVDKIKYVIRLNGFQNTNGLGSNRCTPFDDGRPQVRLTLLIPKDVSDMSKGVHTDRGVLGMCGNPWNVPAQPVPAPPPPPKKEPKPEPKPTPTTAPPVTTTTAPPPVTTTTTAPPPFVCPTDFRPIRTPPRNLRDCEKIEDAHDPGEQGGNGSPAVQPVAENPPAPVVGAPATEPPPAERPQDHPQGGSGSGGAPAPTGPTDNSDAGQVTTVDNQPATCPSGNPVDCN